jgi:hypothetical protein
MQKEELVAAKSWADVQAALAPIRGENDTKVEAARLLFNTTREVEATQRYFEEKCGWPSFGHTNDKTITAGVLGYLGDLRAIATQETWGQPLCYAQVDAEREKVLGSVAFRAWRHMEDMQLDLRRQLWAGRFSGESNEEKQLDFVLQNLSKRTQSPGTGPNTMGEEFDREYEPIGRSVQRRVLTSDLQQPDDKKSFRTTTPAPINPFEKLHRGQVTSILK